MTEEEIASRIAELEVQIGPLEQELSTLNKRLGQIRGGQASAAARKDETKDYRFRSFHYWSQDEYRSLTAPTEKGGYKRAKVRGIVVQKDETPIRKSAGVSLGEHSDIESPPNIPNLHRAIMAGSFELGGARSGIGWPTNSSIGYLADLVKALGPGERWVTVQGGGYQDGQLLPATAARRYYDADFAGKPRVANWQEGQQPPFGDSPHPVAPSGAHAEADFSGVPSVDDLTIHKHGENFNKSIVLVFPSGNCYALRADQYSAVYDSVLAKALGPGERWITVKPHGPDAKGVPVLIRENPDGSAHVIGGAGGKLNYLKLKGVKSPEHPSSSEKTKAGFGRDGRIKCVDLAVGA